MGHLSAVSEHAEGLDPNKKHRHDIGAVDHGPHSTERTTKSIQVVIGTSIALTIAFTIYAMLSGWFEISA